VAQSEQFRFEPSSAGGSAPGAAVSSAPPSSPPGAPAPGARPSASAIPRDSPHHPPCRRAAGGSGTDARPGVVPRRRGRPTSV